MKSSDLERKFEGLKDFIPENSLPKLIPYFQKYPIQLKITKDRKSIRGDYRQPNNALATHRISVNGTLNKYSFLITLLHEIAHLLTFLKYKNKVAPHGKEWKKMFGEVLSEFLNDQFFPQEIEVYLKNSLNNLKATTCADVDLDRALRQYDLKKKNVFLLEEIPSDSCFQIEDGRTFKKIQKLRTRYRCQEIKSGKLYFVSGRTEVKIVS